MTRKEILFSGFGGQGVVTSGRLLGHAATLAGLRASMLISHGTETRGGYVRSQVVISDAEIDSPVAERPDIFCALSQAAYTRFAPAAANGEIFYDPAFVTPDATREGKLLAVPARAIALQTTGEELCANMVLLGVVIRRLALIPPQLAERTIRECLSQRSEVNLQALQAGCRFLPETA